MKRARIAFFSFVLTACGASSHARAPGIEDLRRAARERPSDAGAQRTLAEAELLMRDGNPAAAEAAIGRAQRLRRNDVRLSYLRGLEREVHGHLSDALDAYLEVMTLAARSQD